MKYILIFLLFSCSSPKNENYLGVVKDLPKGEYTIYNRGSRHIVSCIREDGKYYNLNDSNFKRNGIKGNDAHQYRKPTKILVK